MGNKRQMQQQLKSVLWWQRDGIKIQVKRMKMVVSTHRGRTADSTFFLTTHNMPKKHYLPLVPPSFPGLTTSHDSKTGPSPCWANATAPPSLSSSFISRILGTSWGFYFSLSLCQIYLTHSSQSWTFLKAGTAQIHSPPLKLIEISFIGWASSGDELM